MSGDLDRERYRRAERDRNQTDQTNRSGAITLARVTSTGGTLAVGKFLAAIPQVILGSESEGASAVYEDRGATPIFVDQLGPAAPTNGSKIIAHRIPYRWVSRRRGGPCTWVITVSSCGEVGVGVTVTVTIGGTTYSGVTNASRQVTFTNLPAGSATAVAASPSARYNNGTVTRTLVAGSQSNTIGMPVANGYYCGGVFGCFKAIPITLTGTYYLGDGMGGSVPVSLTFGTYGGDGFWSTPISLGGTNWFRLGLGSIGYPGENGGYWSSIDDQATWSRVYGFAVTASSCSPFSIVAGTTTPGSWNVSE